MQLNMVVLPAPFGPITAVISRSRAAKETSFTAMRPPKRMVTCSTERMAAAVIATFPVSVRLAARQGAWVRST